MNLALNKLEERYTKLGGEELLRQPARTGISRAGYTELFLNDDGKSKYEVDADSTPVIYKPSAPCVIDIQKQKGTNDKFLIEGMASTPELDSDRDIIVPEAFESSLSAFLAKGTMLFMHDWFGLPVGVWTKGEISNAGLKVKGELAIKTQMGRDLMELIIIRAINTLSVGFRIIRDEFLHEENIRKILDLLLMETSIVNMPANPGAIFAQAKLLNLKSFIGEPETAPETTKGKRIMTLKPETIKTVELLTKEYDEAAGTAEERFSEIKKKMEATDRLIKGIQTKHNDLESKDSGITKAEFDQYVENVKTDFSQLQTDVNAAIVKRKEELQPKYVFSDWRSLLTKKTFMTDSNGKPLPEIYQSAFKLLSLPVDYNKVPDGELLKGMRNLNDCCIILDTYYKGNSDPSVRYQGMESLECYQKLRELVEYFEKKSGNLVLSKAMAAGTAGSGAEWIPSLLSAEMDTLFRLQNTLVNFVRPTWQMPSDTAHWPILTGAAVAYLTDEPATANPIVLKKTKISTGKVLFTTRTFAAAVPVSKIILEDMLIDLVPVIREELVTSLNKSEEDAILNGDASATHFDTGTGLIAGNDDVRVAYKGLRKEAIDLSNNWDSQSVTLGDGTTAFAAKDVRYNRQLLGVLGVDPSQCLHVTSIEAYFKMLNFSEVTKANEFGFASTWLSGRLPALDGVEILISQLFPANLNASGIFDNSVTTRTGLITLHKESFMPGERRGITLEFALNIDTQQWLFVGTQRRDWKNMRPSTQKPVAYAYNVLN